MKLAIFALLFSTLSFAGEIKTYLSERHNGLSFALYEETYPSDKSSLRQFAQSLLQTGMNTTDNNFSFRCSQKLHTNSVVETRCQGILKEMSHTSSTGTIGDDFIFISLNGDSARDFLKILPKIQDGVSINLQDKFFLMGNNQQLSIMVRQ